MVAEILAPQHRLAHNRAGANLVSGRRIDAARARDAELGLFEVDEAALPEVIGACARASLCLGNLFRDQLDRYGELEHVAERWREARPRPGPAALGRRERRRPAGRRPRARAARRDVFGLDDPRHARPGSSTRPTRSGASAAERRTSTRPPTSATSATTAARPAATRGRARRGRSRARARRAGRRPLPAGHAGRKSARVELPLPGLYNVYNALAAASLAGARRLAGRRRRRARAVPRGVRPLRADPRRRPDAPRAAGQEPGRRERGRPDAGRRGRAVARRARAERRIADGRDVSWIWDVDFEPLLERLERIVATGGRAAELALRCKYGGLDEDAIEVEPDLGRALDRGLELHAVRAASCRPAHLHGDAGAAADRRRARLRAAVLGAGA